jgi:hypothetical protein
MKDEGDPVPYRGILSDRSLDGPIAGAHNADDLGFASTSMRSQRDDRR